VDALPMRLVAAFRPEVNAWQGTEGLQLTIEHWWPAPWRWPALSAAPSRRSI